MYRVFVRSRQLQKAVIDDINVKINLRYYGIVNFRILEASTMLTDMVKLISTIFGVFKKFQVQTVIFVE